MPRELQKQQVEGVAWEAARRSQGLSYSAFFYDMGTGKTLMAYECALNWWNAGRRKFIVVAPKSVCAIWAEEALKWSIPFRVEYFMSDVAESRKAVIRAPWDVLVVNYDGLRLFQQQLIAQRPQGMIMDEFQKIKNRSAKATEAAWHISKAVADNNGFRIGMSGTPMTKSPLDLWSEFNVLSPNVDQNLHPLGYGSYHSFEAQVCEKRPHPHIKGIYLYKYPPEALATLKGRLAEHALEAREEDCQDLPQKHYRQVNIPMLLPQQAVYSALQSDMVAYLEAIERKQAYVPVRKDGLETMEDLLARWSEETQPRNTDRVSVTLKTVLMTRLQQVAAGHVKTDDGSIRPVPSAKIEWLEEHLPLLTEPLSDNKCIIFTRFREDVVQLAELCKKMKLGAVTLTGDNSKEASALQKRFQTESGLRVFISNVAVGSLGLTLTAANKVVFYSNSYAWGDRRQAEKRAHRIGQERPVEYIDLLCKDSIDYYVLNNLSDKDKLVASTVRGLKNIILHSTEEGEVSAEMLELFTSDV